MTNQSEHFDIVLANGRVIDPETYLDGIYNVGINGGQIATITKDKLDGKEVVDASAQRRALARNGRSPDLPWPIIHGEGYVMYGF